MVWFLGLYRKKPQRNHDLWLPKNKRKFFFSHFQHEILMQELQYNVLFFEWFCSYVLIKQKRFSKKNAKKWHSNAKTVINVFFLHWFCSWLFTWSFRKNLEKSLMTFQCQDWYVFFLHWFCSWLFMKLQQKKLEEIFDGISMPRLGYKVLLSNWLFLT